MAEKIKIILNTKKSNTSSLQINKETIINFIFTIDSKNRIIAILMGLCAATIVLSISSGASLDNLFELIEGKSIESILFMLFIPSIFIMTTYLIIKYFLIILDIILSSFFDRLDGLNAQSERREKIFISQLVALHELPKGRIRVKAKI